MLFSGTSASAAVIGGIAALYSERAAAIFTDPEVLRAKVLAALDYAQIYSPIDQSGVGVVDSPVSLDPVDLIGEAFPAQDISLTPVKKRC